MRQRAKLIVFAALSAALTVAGLSIAAGGGGSGGSAETDRGAGGKGAKLERGFGGPHRMALDRDVAEVLREIHEAVEKKAPEIAGPVIQKAEDAGDITSDQADALRAAAQAVADGERPGAAVRRLLRDADVREVVRDAFAAAAEEAPAIAAPIIDEAVEDDRITEAEADEIRAKLEHAPRFGPGHRFGPGRFGPGHGHGGPHGFGRLDRDVAAVLRDVHEAVERKRAEIAAPILDEAVEDGKITEAQADRIRDRRLGRLDRDLAAVLREIHEAVAEQAPAIAKPIIDEALEEGKITEAQADRIRERLEHRPRFRGGPPALAPGRPA